MHAACSFLLGVDDAAVTEIFLMCSPSEDHDHVRDWLGWHRDFSPSNGVPLQALVENMVENGPTYVQLNLPLYDDEVLYLQPGSHRRLTTAAELSTMAGGLVGDSRSLHAPLPGSVQVKLKAGDLAVYLSPTILHWGSSYQREPLRRTLHGGYSTQHGACLGPNVWRYLRLSSAEAFRRWQQRAEVLASRSGDAILAVAIGDADRFHRALNSGYGLQQPVGPHGARLRLIQLATVARSMMDALERDRLVPEGWTAQQIRQLWNRLEPIQAAMQCDTKQWEPGFQGEPGYTLYSRLPTALVQLGEDLVATVFAPRGQGVGGTARL